MKSYELSPSEQVKRLEASLIKSTILAHPAVQANSIIPEATSSAMTERFKVIWDKHSNPEVVPREKSLSAQAAGLFADTTETIENLLLTDFKNYIWQDQTAGKRVEENSPPAQPQRSSNERFKELKGKYLKAKESGDRLSMVTITRVACEEGYIFL
jgi:hypothetical protein